MEYSTPDFECVEFVYKSDILAESVTTSPEVPTDIISTENDFEFG